MTITRAYQDMFGLSLTEAIDRAQRYSVTSSTSYIVYFFSRFFDYPELGERYKFCREDQWCMLALSDNNIVEIYEGGVSVI